MIILTNVKEQLKKIDKLKNEYLVDVLVNVQMKQDAGEKIIVKEKIIKTGTYINIYVYDNTCWKYLLSQVIKVN